MNPLQLPIEINQSNTAMHQAVLAEIGDHLTAMVSSGREHVIDLTSLPMTDSDKRELAALLGKGEVSITLTTIGESEIYETAYSGVWWIKHYSTDSKLIAELIEITRVPEIIKSHPEDIQKSAVELGAINTDRNVALSPQTKPDKARGE